MAVSATKFVIELPRPRPAIWTGSSSYETNNKFPIICKYLVADDKQTGPAIKIISFTCFHLNIIFLIIYNY